jgi:hypothetical protein
MVFMNLLPQDASLRHGEQEVVGTVRPDGAAKLGLYRAADQLLAGVHCRDRC